MPNIVIDIASEFTGKKAFNQAEKSTNKLEKGVAGLGKTLGVTFGAGAVVAFGKAAFKAFVEDENAARSLGLTLKNLGLDFGNNTEKVNAFIDQTERSTGVLDDELRPAMDRLLRATGSVTKSQDLLNLSLDIAAGTGKSVTQVSQALQKAFLGQTQAIGRLGVGLSKAELASGDFESITAKLSTLFAGQASSAADSYAGKMAILQVNANNAKEIIGKGLVDALGMLGEDDSVTNLGNSLESIALVVADITRGIGTLAAGLKNIPGAGLAGKAGEDFWLNALFPGLGGVLSWLRKLGKEKVPTTFQTGMSVTGATDAGQADKLAAEKAEKAALAAAAAAEKERKAKIMADKAAAAAKLAADKKAAANKAKLDKAASQFDLERIGISAALKGKITKEEETRLLLLLALKNEDAAAADKLSKELDVIQKKNEELAKALANLPAAKDPFAGWMSTLASVSAQLAAINNVQIGTKMFEIRQKESGFTPPTPVVVVPSPIAKEITSNAPIEGFTKAVESLATVITNVVPTGASSIFNPSPFAAVGGPGAGTQFPISITVNNNGTTLMQDEFVKVVNDAVVIANTQGLNTKRPGGVGFRADEG